jgi:sulfite reductase (NADPH) hemoprotein beta-component
MTDDVSRNERIKEASDYLRGTLAEGLREEITGGIVEDDQQLVKFHGMYLQDDRDLRPERTRKKMEKAFAFMIRVRIPGGVLTPQQWLALDEVSRVYGNGTMRLTTRQTVQLHGVIKSNLKATLKAIDTVLLNSIAACGDINRNVMCNVLPEQSRAHAAAIELARSVSDHLLPHTPAYRNGSRRGSGRGGGNVDRSGKTTAPQFKPVAVAEHAFAHIRLHRSDRAAIHRLECTAAAYDRRARSSRTAYLMGFCETADAVKIAEAVVSVQRDWGDRKSRKHARLKYTIEDRGLDAFRAEVERRAGVKLAPPKPFTFTSTGDRYGWSEGSEGRSHLTLFVQNGRVHDVGGAAQQTALRTIAQMHDGEFRITPNQNLVIANVPTGQQAEIERIVREAGLLAPWSGLRRNSMACVALPTCGLALAESERYLPDLLTALDEQLAAHGLSADDIVIRMTGCPNGCARPYLAEIGLVGKGPGRYNLYLGAAFDGSRMNKLYAEDLDHAGIVAAPSVVCGIRLERQKGERFGDYAIRAGFVAASGNGRDFHANVGKQRTR